MGRLRGSIAGVSKNKLIEAIVIEKLGSLISVQLSVNGSKLIGIPFTGGPTSVGAKVFVDYSSGKPIALVMGEAYTPPAQRKKIEAVIQPEVVDSELDLSNIILTDVSEGIKIEYPYSEAGLDSAITDSETGDHIWIPAGTIELTSTTEFVADTAIEGAGIDATNLTGRIILNNDCTMMRITVINQLNDANECVAIECKGDVTITECEADAFQCGTGDAAGIKQTSAGNVVVKASQSNGESQYGDGWAIWAYA